MAAAVLCGGDTAKAIGLRYPRGRQSAVRSAFDALAVKPARRLRMNSEALVQVLLQIRFELGFDFG